MRDTRLRLRPLFVTYLFVHEQGKYAQKKFGNYGRVTFGLPLRQFT